MFTLISLVAIATAIRTVAGQSGSTTIGGLSGSHTDIPRWCGKPYMLGSPNFNPGGMLQPPKPSTSQLLDVQVQPRYSIYDSSEKTAEFVVDAALSRIHGSPYSPSPPPYSPSPPPYAGKSTDKLDFYISVQNSKTPLATGKVLVNTTGNLVQFDITKLKPSLKPYSITLRSTSKSGHQYSASTELYYLPAKNSGSTVKVDNLYGGLSVANNATKYAFQPLFPFGFYTSCSGYLNYSLANVTAYKKLGFNAINPVCAFTDGDLGYLFDWMDQSNLWYQYDMRGSYLNLSQVAEQIPLVKDRSNLLTYYTADEPDGWQYALNSTSLAYKLLKTQDPYHPTALVLNCENYYFPQYTAGTDIIMEDAYPVGINPTHSRPWGTACNETYGDCGCDNCVGSLADVSDRLDTLQDYQTWIGRPTKPLWAVLQAFSGEGYWSRDPTPQESWAMMLLGFNHRARGMMSWTYPTSAALAQAHGSMARVATAAPVREFLLNASPTTLAVAGKPSLDVAYWKVGSQVMVAVTNLDSSSTAQSISITLPFGVSKISSQPWGSLAWKANKNTISAAGVKGLATSILILNV